MIAAIGLAAQAQIAQPTLPPGKIAVFKAGTSDGRWNISISKEQPCYIQVFDPAVTNAAAPVVSVALATNGAPGSIWINAHAGSEGGGISRSTDRQFLALEGYTGSIPPTNGPTPSSAPGVTRGIVTLDAFANANGIYSDPFGWFGLPSGVTQNNPTGIASTDGTNFWGTGNVTGGSSEAAGVLFFNDQYSPSPLEVENYIQGAAEARIIGGTLYIASISSKNPPFNGIFNFVGTRSSGYGGQVIPLPYDPNVAVPYQTYATTNLFINWGSTYSKVANFDMNPQATIAYGADQTYGIIKFVNNGTGWTQAPYIFGTTNIGSTLQPSGNQGCFGICVDFSGVNPIIYATTMEFGAGTTGNSQGNPNANRLIKIVDTGVNPGTNLVAVTLATAASTNESFRGIDFTPDLTPLIVSQPAGVSTTTNQAVALSVGVNSVYPLSYQWYDNGVAVKNDANLSGATNSTLNFALSSLTNSGSYTVVITNYYGSVTSAVTSVLISPVPILAGNFGPTVYQTNFAGSLVLMSQNFTNGTSPFTYQWYFGTTQLSDDGVKYSGSTMASLIITNVQVPDSGNYYLVVNNGAGYSTNLAEVLTVNYQLPIISAFGQPQSLTNFAGLTSSLSVQTSGGSVPMTFQWYFKNTALTDPGASGDDSGSFATGTTSSTLTIAPSAAADSGNYYCVIANLGGSVTSHIATVLIQVPPAPSAVGYSNQVYVQNFDSLPDPGIASVNSFNNGYVNGQLAGLQYSLGNPFDFAYPILNSGLVGGLGLGAKMSGWYGAATQLSEDPTTSGYTRFGAQDGDQSTGGIIDFGPNDASSTAITGTNRALGLLSTGTTGSTTYALKLTNSTSTTLNYVNIGFIGELWRNGTGARVMSFGYVLDNTANSFVLDVNSISNAATLVPELAFSFPTASVVTPVDGTQPANQTHLNSNNLQLSTPWQPGAALWLIWSMNYYGGGSGNGYAIDNLSFSASANPITLVSQPTLGGVTYNAGTGLTFTFTNTAGAAAQFTTWSTTNLALPFSQWVNLGHPAEVSSGNYVVVDPSSKTNKQTYYKVTSP